MDIAVSLTEALVYKSMSGFADTSEEGNIQDFLWYNNSCQI